MSKNETYSCGYCEAEFTLKRNLIRHTKTSKKCLDARENNIECLWCKDTFMNKEILKKHKCEVNKDEYLKSVMAQRDIEINSLKETISYLKDEINSLRDKLLQIADKNNTTINNTAVTYNVALVCDKPLRLDKQRVLSLMISNCYPNYIIRGEQGLADWFLDCVCRNEEYNLCIECTDKTRKIFKYIDEGDKLRKITGREIISLLTGCFIEFKQSHNWKEFIDRYSEQWETAIYKKESFLNPSNDFINYIIEKTHKESPSNLLTVQ